MDPTKKLEDGGTPMDDYSAILELKMETIHEVNPATTLY